MALGGANSAYLFFWSPEGSSLFIIGKNAALWKKISEVLDDFWELHVKPGRGRYMVDPFDKLGDIVPSDDHQLLPYIYQMSIEARPKLLFYEVIMRSPILWAYREDRHFVDLESYYKIEAPIAGRLKRRDLSTSDIVFLGLTMYDEKKFLIALDDSLLGYILHCQNEGVSSIVSQELYMEAMYDALLRELVNHSEKASTSSLQRSLKMDAAASIKSGKLCPQRFFTWAITITVRWRLDMWINCYRIRSFMKSPYEEEVFDIFHVEDEQVGDEQRIKHRGWIRSNDKTNRAFGTRY
ncbi:unnamed protein product [Microthlaspi erraticum]|uniref:Uncharacterized protein n=1 Tax=Microthlaspi erraticum TaxID=1685480 RepID=A0A6D2KBK7_9BRAS|nr:unnamed protein product [Microthlaspi erraticum]CAA7045532.1 unnamed protein product [Microthlaspi erraticum]